MKRLSDLFRCAFIALALWGPVATDAAEDDTFAQGNQEYAAGQFREAIDHYSALVSRGELSAALFYNLANAWYRTGDLGHAILNYERALALEPHHPETEANLRLVRDKARALELQRTWFDKAIERGTPMQYTIAAAVSFWIGAFALAVWILSRRRRLPAFVFALSLITLSASLYGVYALATGPIGQRLAIVTAKATDARLATADSAGTVLALPPGSEIKILNTRGDWTYAALPNDLRGWIPARNAELVRM